MIERPLRAGAFVIALALPVLVLALIVSHAVNIPFQDEWEWTDFLQHLHDGSLTFAELWRPHNEHRIVVANILMLAMSRFGGWDIMREECFSLGMVVVTQAVMFQLIRRTIAERFVPFAFCAVSLLLYSLSQVENFINGFQFPWSICSAAVTFAVFVLSDTKRTARSVIYAGLAATVASYSSSQGLLAWPIGAALLAMTRPRSIRLLTAWICWGIAAFVVDSLGYVAQRHPPVHDLAAYAAYVLAYLGGPLASLAGVQAAIIVGIALVAAITGFAVIDIVSAGGGALPDGSATRLPWYAFGCYALLGAAATATARLDLGVGQALSYRYSAIASMLTIALVAILFTWMSRALRDMKRSLLAASVVTLAVALSTIASSLNGLRYWDAYDAQRRADIDAIRVGNTAALGDLYPSESEVVRFIGELRTMRDGMFHP